MLPKNIPFSTIRRTVEAAMVHLLLRSSRPSLFPYWMTKLLYKTIGNFLRQVRSGNAAAAKHAQYYGFRLDEILCVSYGSSIEERTHEALKKAQAAGFFFVSFDEATWLVKDAEMHALPAGVFVSSASGADLLSESIPTAAVVGTRTPTPYGLMMTERIVGEADNAAVVVPFALGIAETAINICLAQGRPCIAVLGGGAGNVYPLAMQDLYARLVDTPGCGVVTPFFPDEAPLAYNMIARNRIVALANSITVVESKEKGGGMIAARFGKEFCRDVRAVPGRWGDETSAGCNRLIAEGTAELWTGAIGKS